MVYKRKVLEKDVKSPIIDKLNYDEAQGKLYHFKSQSGSIPIPQPGKPPRWFSTGRKGCQDHTICLKVKLGGENFGVYVGFEFKRPKGARRPEQITTEKFIDSLGGYYFFIDDYYEAEKALLFVKKDMARKVTNVKMEEKL